MATTAAQTPAMSSPTVAEKPVQQKAQSKKVISPGISLLSGAVAGGVEATATVCLPNPQGFARSLSQQTMSLFGTLT